MFKGFNDPSAEVSSELESLLLIARAIIAVGALLVFVIAAIVSLVFLYRSNANLHASNVQGLEYTPGWAVGYWFIPFVNLIRPYQVTKEIFERSGGAAASDVSSLLGGWWACWVIGNILGRLESRLDAEALGAMVLPLSWASSLVTLASGICFVMIVRGITKRQGF